MNKLLILFIFPIIIFAQQRIVIIDTGIDKKVFNSNKSIFCKDGHKDFTGHGLNDAHGHGTNVSSLIDKYANYSDYCQIILKIYHNGYSSVRLIQKSIDYAIKIKADIINISFGGEGYSSVEHRTILRALNNNITIIAAAGNDGKSLNGSYKYYPASYDNRIIVVGNMGFKSNYGTIVDKWEYAVNVVGRYGIPLTGTSQATAIYSGRYINDKQAKKRN
jgi:hypothetical protein